MRRISILLEEMQKVAPDNKFFSLPASLAQIEAFQAQMGIMLPAELIDFYNCYNGAFIAIGHRDQSNIKDPSHIDDAAWASNVFLSLEEMAAAYFQEKGSYGFVNIKKIENANDKRFIPIVITNQQNYYLLNILNGHQTGVYNLSRNPIGDNYLLSKSKYEEFEDLLEDYITNNGRIE